MNVSIQTGDIHFSDLSASETLTLAHGGAGPQDPKGNDRELAKLALKEILQNNEESEVPLFLREKFQEASSSERLAYFVSSQLEAHPMFNAGRGGSLQADGCVRVSASFMESE